MKRILLLSVLFGLLSISKAWPQFEGTVGMGVHVGYANEISSLGTGINLHYYLTNEVRVAPSLIVFSKHKGMQLWMAEADAHYMLPISLTASLYPIAGIHLSNWKYSGTKVGESVTEEWSKDRLGLNLGLGYQYDISFRVRANFEMKYQLIRGFSQLYYSAGIGFWL
jgi:opacity protein-like surface antigen